MLDAAIGALIECRPIRVIFEVGPPVFSVPISVSDGHVGIKQIPSMRPQAHGQTYFLAQEVEIRVIRHFLDNRGGREQKTSAAEYPTNWSGWRILHLYGASCHG